MLSKKIVPSIFFSKVDLPAFLTKSKRVNTFSDLTPKDKLALKKWATQPEAFVFRDILLNSMTSKILHNLATTEEGVTTGGIAKAERMRGQLAMIIEIRQLLERGRKHQPKEGDDKEDEASTE